MASQKRISIRRTVHRMDEITKLTEKDAEAPDLTVEGNESGLLRPKSAGISRRTSRTARIVNHRTRRTWRAARCFGSQAMSTAVSPGFRALRGGAVALQVFGPVRVVTSVSEGLSASRSHAGIPVGIQDGRDLSAVTEPQRGIWLLRQWGGAGSAYFTTSTVLA